MPQVVAAVPIFLQAAGVITATTAAMVSLGLVVASPVYGEARQITKTDTEKEKSNEHN